MLFEPIYVFIVLVKFDRLLRNNYSLYDIFSKYKYLVISNCQLGFFPPRFLELEFLSDCAFS